MYNSIKGHPENVQFIILGNTGLHALQIGDITTKSVSSVTLLGITIDSKLNFKEDTVDSLYLDYPLSRTSLYFEQKAWSLGHLCTL